MKNTIADNQETLVGHSEVSSEKPELEADDLRKDFKKKPDYEECKVLSYNAYTGNLAFVYKGSDVQITAREGMKFEDTVKVRYANGKYNIVD